MCDWMVEIVYVYFPQNGVMDKKKHGFILYDIFYYFCFKGQIADRFLA